MANLLRDEAYERLSGLIKSGALEPGVTYSLNALAADMGMSRTPVRDAVQRLADESRVDVLPSRGIRLHEMSEAELTQHYHFSSAVEGYCACQLAKRQAAGEGDECVARLASIQSAMAELLDEASDFSAYFSLDQRFHAELLDSLGDAQFSGFKSSHLGFYGHPELQRADGEVTRRAVFDCHQAILDAISAGDHLGAFDALQRHAELMTRAYRRG